jgi:hypothetical protein
MKSAMRGPERNARAGVEDLVIVPLVVIALAIGKLPPDWRRRKKPAVTTSAQGLGKRRRLRVDQPTITERTHPAPDARSPLFACLCRSIHRTQTTGLSAFFLETEGHDAACVACAGPQPRA